MNIDELCKYKKNSCLSNTFISFTGPFSQGIIVELGSAVKKYISSKTDNKTKTYDVFSIFIEQAQNISMYINSKKENTYLYKKLYNSGIITIDESEEKYTITSGNIVQKSDIELLKNKIDSLNSLNIEELKEMRKAALKGKIENKELGFIVIARKACSKLVYSFTDIDEELSFFQLEIKV